VQMLGHVDTMLLNFCRLQSGSILFDLCMPYKFGFFIRARSPYCQ
jgi:hypothetical protein